MPRVGYRVRSALPRTVRLSNLGRLDPDFHRLSCDWSMGTSAARPAWGGLVLSRMRSSVARKRWTCQLAGWAMYTNIEIVLVPVQLSDMQDRCSGGLYGR